MQTQATPGSLEHWAGIRPNAQALMEGDRSLTWRVWNPQADLLAGALAARGLVAGDIVVVRTHIRLEWSVIAAMGTPTSEARMAADPDRAKKIMEKYIIRRLGKPEGVANMAPFLSSGASDWITGQACPVNGGFTFAL